jgi:hypothetical protein
MNSFGKRTIARNIVPLNGVKITPEVTLIYYLQMKQNEDMAHLASFTVFKRIQIHQENHFNFNREKRVDKDINNMKLQIILNCNLSNLNFTRHKSLVQYHNEKKISIVYSKLVSKF